MKLPKLKLTSSTVGGLILLVTSCFIIFSVRYDFVTQVPEPLVPDVVEPDFEPIRLPLYELTEVTVESSSGLYQGGGLRVGDIVVTSAMIFNGEDQIVTIEGIITEVVYHDAALGLVALRGVKTFETLYNMPNPPVGTQLMISGLRQCRVKVSRYMDDGDRMIISGDVPVYSTGYPVMMGIDVVGLVVGLNSVDVKQGIAVSLQGLEKFIGGLK